MGGWVVAYKILLSVPIGIGIWGMGLGLDNFQIFPKVTILSITFIFGLSEIFTRQTDSKSDSLQVTVQVDTDC